MIEFTVKMTESDRSYGGKVFGDAFTQRIRKFQQGLTAVQVEAAKAANMATGAAATSKRPPVPMRLGRETTNGNFATRMQQWKPSADDGVEFDMQAANQRAPYWIIQEIGTGHTATMKRGGSPNPQGRQRAGTTQVSVPSQVGRYISPAFGFGTGPTGQYTPFGAAAGQGLYLRSRLKGAPIFAAGRAKGVRITKEIPAKNFVQAGSKAGFRLYRRSVLAAAQASFSKPKTLP